jgi:hypothetical protein
MGVRRIALIAAILLCIGTLTGLFLEGTAQAVNPNLAKNSHGRMANGKALPHVSGASEVTFDEERALGADAQNAAADLPPDATVSARMRKPWLCHEPAGESGLYRPAAGRGAGRGQSARSEQRDRGPE